MVDRVGAGFCPEPQPAGPHHIPRHTVVEDLDRILMQDQPSKFYYVVTGAHGKHYHFDVHACMTCINDMHVSTAWSSVSCNVLETQKSQID